MKIEKLSENCYRVRKTYKKKTYPLYFDHKPTQKEIAIALADSLENSPKNELKGGTVNKCIADYLEARKNVLSPSTYKEYKRIYDNVIPKEFGELNIYDITNEDIQQEVNRYAVDRAYSTVRNYYSLIRSAVLSKRTNLNIHCKLPQKKGTIATIPAKDDVIKLISAFKGTEYSVPIQLGCHGLRRSEIIALTLSDLDGNKLTINKAMVENADKKFIIKDTNKNYTSTRVIAIADSLADEIREKGYIYKGHPNNILRALHREQDRLKIPRCKLHELRHYYVSYAHENGMSDANIIKNTGHKTNSIMRATYLHAMEVEKEQSRIANSLFN